MASEQLRYLQRVSQLTLQLSQILLLFAGMLAPNLRNKGLRISLLILQETAGPLAVPGSCVYLKTQLDRGSCPSGYILDLDTEALNALKQCPFC